MTAADITTSLTGFSAEENVVITVTDGETYVTKMSSPQLVQATWQEAVTVSAASALSCTLSGRTITIAAGDIVDKKLALTIKGYL